MRKSIIIFALLLAGLANAQTKPAAKVSIDATTKDGRQVTLKPDGTWVFKTASSATADSIGSIEIEAAVIYKSGEVVPAARSKFYLLTDSAESLFNTDAMRSLYLADASKSMGGSADKNPQLADIVRGAYRYEILYPTMTEAFRTALSKSIKKEITTDFAGKGVFSDLPAGTYHLLGMTSTRRSSAIWSMTVEVTSGSLKLMLDQNNAIAAY